MPDVRPGRYISTLLPHLMRTTLIAVFAISLSCCGREDSRSVAHPVRTGPVRPSPIAPPAPTPTVAIEPMRVGGEVVEPIEVFRTGPDYSRIPPSARGLGVCIFESTIGADGHVTGIRLLRPYRVAPTCKPAIDEFARTLALWRYKPASFRGRPVPVYLTVTVTHCISCTEE